MRGEFDGHSFAHHDFGHGHFSHDFKDRRFARGFGFGGLYDYGYWGWPVLLRLQQLLHLRLVIALSQRCAALRARQVRLFAPRETDASSEKHDGGAAYRTPYWNN
jgi:hypothetical protein